MRKTVSARLYEAQQLEEKIRAIINDCGLSYLEKIRAIEVVLGM